MDQTFDESIKLEPDKLLEHFWFFSNVMSQNASHSCTPSNQVFMCGRSYEDTYELIKKAWDDPSCQSSLIRAPSLPPPVDRNDQFYPENEEIIQDEESEFCMGKLIRQASLINSETFVPRRSSVADKGLTARSRIVSRHGSITKLELRGPEKLRCQDPMGKLKTRKSLNDLELYKELQGFKDFGLYSESQSSVRPVAKKSSEDIKAQIKFWARAVASNVRF